MGPNGESTIELIRKPKFQITADMLITELRLLETSDRLLGLYELGLLGCDARDAAHVNLVLDELIACLDFDHYHDIAESFHRVYVCCAADVAKGNFDGTAFVFADLRDALARAATDDATAAVASAGQR